jgi:predicted nucleotidyltransferase
MNKKLLLPYAEDFVSFLLEKIDYSLIKDIVLFGSVAREEANEDSDVDIFIDLAKEDNRVKEKIMQAVQKFYASARCKEYWNLRGVKNEFALKVGKIDEWKELKNSIISNGKTLYGKYVSVPQGKHITYYIWENIHPETKRILCSKRLFGYMQNEKRYIGLLEKYSGTKVGKGIIAVPTEYSTTFTAFFRENKITVKIRKVLDYS